MGFDFIGSIRIMDIKNVIIFSFFDFVSFIIPIDFLLHSVNDFLFGSSLVSADFLLSFS